MHTNRDISAQYDKWIRKLIITGKSYFVLWGYDKTDEGKTKMLIDVDNNLLFKSPTELLAYISKKKGLFDTKHTLKWYAELSAPARSNSAINIDLLQNAILKFEDKASFEELMNSWDIVDDLAYQTDDKKLFRLCQSKQTKHFFYLNYNKYLSTKVEKNIQKDLKALDRDKVIEQLNKLYALFLEKLVVVK